MSDHLQRSAGVLVDLRHPAALPAIEAVDQRLHHRPYGILEQLCDDCESLATWFETALGVDGHHRVVARHCRRHRRLLFVVR